MKKRDKLDRCRTSQTAVLTQSADVPFWVTLTPNERRRFTPQQIRQFHLLTGTQRKAFRDFIRQLAAGGAQ